MKEQCKSECDYYNYETTSLVNKLRCRICGNEIIRFRNLYPDVQ